MRIHVKIAHVGQRKELNAIRNVDRVAVITEETGSVREASIRRGKLLQGRTCRYLEPQLIKWKFI